MSASKQAFSADDLYRYRAIEEIRCAPDGSSVVYVQKSVDRDQDGYRTSLWRVALDGGEARELTQRAGTSNNTPRFFPDGNRLAFVSDRAGALQVFVLPLDGGEARQLTTFPNAVLSYEIAPDGSRLLVTASQRVDPNARGVRDDPPPQGKTPEIAWRLPYKSDGLGYLLDRVTHAFVVDLGGEAGDPRQLTRGAFEVRSAHWSPDGKRIAYTRTREGRQAHRVDLWTMNADGSSKTQLSFDLAICQHPKWSPDGRTIVLSGSGEEGEAQVRLWKVDVEARRVEPLGPDSLEVVGGESVVWTSDGKRVRFVNARRGRQEIAEVDVATGHYRTILRGETRQLVAFASAAGRIAFASRRLDEPSDLYAANDDGSGEKRLTDLNPWWRERVQPRVVVRQFRVPDGKGGKVDIDGWLVTGENAPAGPLPLLVDAHGGPNSYVDIDYARYVHWTLLWSRGFAILATNGAGSSSYGREFADSIRGHWGERCLPQHLTAIDTLQRERLTDERIATTGKSYGGFLAAWAIGHTDRFKAAVVSAPVGNLESHFGTSDGGYYVSKYALRAEPYENRDVARRLSPVQFVHLATTPTLILQGKDDQRCPVGQAEELFATIMRATDTPCELVLYPGETHHLAESGAPSMRVDYYNRIVEWIERWTVGEESTEPAPPPTAAARGDEDQRKAEPEPAPAR